MKAVLVIDIPNGYGDVYDNKAVVTLRNGKLGTSLGIYNVPLRPLPERKKMPKHYANRDYTQGIVDGWNRCWDEVTGVIWD